MVVFTIDFINGKIIYAKDTPDILSSKGAVDSRIKMNKQKTTKLSQVLEEQSRVRREFLIIFQVLID